MTEWLQLISETSLQRDKLAALASSQNDMGWRQELNKAQKLKVRHGSNTVQSHLRPTPNARKFGCLQRSIK